MPAAAQFSPSSKMGSPSGASVFSEFHRSSRPRFVKRAFAAEGVRPTPIAVWEDSKELKLQPDTRLLREDLAAGERGDNKSAVSNDVDSKVFTVSGRELSSASAAKIKFEPGTQRRSFSGVPRPGEQLHHLSSDVPQRPSRSMTHLGMKERDLERGNLAAVRAGWCSPGGGGNLATSGPVAAEDVARTPSSCETATSAPVEMTAAAATARSSSEREVEADTVTVESSGRVQRPSTRTPSFGAADAARYGELQKEWQTSVSREVGWEESVQKSLNKWAVNRARLEEEMTKRNETARLMTLLPIDYQTGLLSGSFNKPRDPIIDLHEMFMASGLSPPPMAPTSARPMSASSVPLSSGGSFVQGRSQPLSASGQYNYLHIPSSETLQNMQAARQAKGNSLSARGASSVTRQFGAWQVNKSIQSELEELFKKFEEKGTTIPHERLVRALAPPPDKTYESCISALPRPGSNLMSSEFWNGPKKTTKRKKKKTKNMHEGQKNNDDGGSKKRDRDKRELKQKASLGPDMKRMRNVQRI